MPELASWVAIDDAVEHEALIRLLNQRLGRWGDLLARCQRLRQRVVITTASTLTEADDVVFGDTAIAGADITLTLPPAAGRAGFPIVVQRIAGAHNLILDPFASELIDGGSTLTTTSARILSDGTQWRTTP